MRFFEKKKEIFELISQNLLVLGIVLLFLEKFSNIIVSTYININLLTIITFILFFSFLVLKAEKNQKLLIPLKKYSKYVFLVGLLFVTISSLRFEFLTNLNWFSLFQNFFETNQFYLTLITIGFGFYSFYFERDRIETEIEKEQLDEEKAEKKREKEFDKKYPFFTKFNFSYKVKESWKKQKYLDSILRAIISPFIGIARIPYTLTKWMYKEGWIYIISIIFLIIIGFILRIWNLSWFQGSDNFNILSARALYETGSYIYSRNIHYTHIINWFFEIFGVSLEVSKYIFIIYSTLTILAFYFLGKLFNKKVGIIGAVLFSLSPVAIEKAGLVREYSELLLLTIIILILISKYLLPSKNSEDAIIKTFIIGLLLIVITILYFFIFNVSTFPFVLIIASTYLWLILFFYKHYKINKLFSKLFFIVPIIIFIISIGTRFFDLGTADYYWFKMFFDPSIEFPMQWFSGASVDITFYFFLFLLALMFLAKNKLKSILFSTFFTIVLVFVLFFNNHLGYNPSRYLFPLYAIYILIFSLVFYILSIYFKTTIKKYLAIILIIILLNIFIIPQNVLIATNHTLDQSYIDGRQVTSLGVRNFYFNILETLENLGLNNETAIIVYGEQPFFISWHFNYTLNRSYMPETTSYLASRDKGMEIGDKVYYINHRRTVNELPLALENHNEGYFLHQYWWNTPINTLFESNYNVEEIMLIESYKIYKWSRD